eukprot:CAMPEP_0172511490 /NCGR_PEP_ID=MMETSP1066-20121228/236873_1 /TAXON_ID=671091 /ORGANISM="Coscinodiscus wailesii, Strain CCMP2513" /LENGTH=674 /DNA_ID=CAMNT_0013290889 /DNA_START=168 /DNA_END=2189 /DNA_ORIENTATION=+
MEEDDEMFRRVQAGASLAIGRSIVSILYDRSSRGPRTVAGIVGGVRRRRRNEMENEGSSSTTAAAGKALPTGFRCHLNSFPCLVTNEIRAYGERYSVTKFRSSYLLDESQQAISTISVAFSNDGMALASTHGDHSVKITCCHSGRLLRRLDGHPRTPWTVKFHPTNSKIVASGCLGFQVRIWNWRRQHGVCIDMIRLDYAIISLAFHPTGSVLAVASGSSLHLWNYDDTQAQDNQDTYHQERDRDRARMGTMDIDSHSHSHTSNNYNIQNHHTATAGDRNSEGSTALHHNQSIQHGAPVGRGTSSDVNLGRSLRCVHFPPGGNTIIVGNVNPPIEGGGGMSFSLKLYDFDMHSCVTGLKPAIANPRTFIHRALLYNDGGFDVSPCGNFLCACAEFWLPEGINCAMDLFPRDELDSDDNSDADEEDGKSCDGCHSQSTFLSSPDKDTQSRSSSTTPPRSYRTSTSARQSCSESTSHSQWYPVTPPIPTRQPIPLSPPSPPGRRLVSNTTSSLLHVHHPNAGRVTIHRSIPPPPPPHVSPASRGTASIEGRFSPHVVLVSLDTSRPDRLGELLEASPLDGAKASGVTCVKFSPSSEFLLLGYGVRESTPPNNNRDTQIPCHPVTALYRIRGGMTHVATMMSQNDDVNIARFHPHSGHGFVYGTKQGKVRILSPKPW